MDNFAFELPKFIDIHAHAYKWPIPPRPDGKKWFSTPEELLIRYDELNIERAVLLPIVNSEVYLPQSNEEVLDICRTWPERFSAFCNIDPRVLTNSPDAQIGYLLDYYKAKGCLGVGEIMANLPFMDPKVQNLFRCIEMAELPLIFDIAICSGGDYGLIDDQGLPQLKKSLENFPKLKIFGHGPAFWAEIAPVKCTQDRIGYPGFSFGAEGVVPQMFRDYPNLYGDLSAGSGYNAMARNPEYAVHFLNEFQDRLCFGTDICAPDQAAPMAGFLKGLLEKRSITREVFGKIAHKNARKILGFSFNPCDNQDYGKKI